MDTHTTHQELLQLRPHPRGEVHLVQNGCKFTLPLLVDHLLAFEKLCGGPTLRSAKAKHQGGSTPADLITVSYLLREIRK